MIASESYNYEEENASVNASSHDQLQMNEVFFFFPDSEAGLNLMMENKWDLGYLFIDGVHSQKLPTI